MKKRLSKEEKNLQIVIELMNKMFEIAGHQVTYDDIKDRRDAWYLDWTMTVEQNEEWKQWGTDYIKKQLKTTKELARREMEMVALMWGLKFSDFEYKTTE